MKKTKSLKNASNTEGVQIVKNNAPIQQQINIQNLHGTISDIQSLDKEPVTTSISLIKKAIAESETDKALKLLLALLLVSSVNIFAQDYTFTQKHVTPVLKRGSDRVSLLTFIGGAFAVGLANPSDDSVRAEWKNNQKMDKSTALIGDLLGTVGVAVLSSGFQYLFDERKYV